MAKNTKQTEDMNKDLAPTEGTELVPAKGKLAEHLSSHMEKGRQKVKDAQDKLFPEHWEDGEFMDDVRQATLRGAHPAANLLFWGIGIFCLIAFLWAGVAEIDEVTRGEGKVIPSSKVQVLQNLEGGIIKEVRVREGDIVEKGQPLIIIDDTGFASSYGEKKSKYLTLQAQLARMEAEINETAPVWPVEVTNKAPEIIEEEHIIYLSRKEELQSSLDILRRQSEQKEQELKEVTTRHQQAARNYELSKEELDLTIPLEKEGVVSRVEILRLKRTVNDMLAEKEATELAIPRVQSSLREANRRVEEKIIQYRNETLKELSGRREEYNRLAEVMKAVEDQVERTTVRAPVRGTIKQVLVHTRGGVVQPGMELIELIPLEDSLLVEAQIRPADIAFLRPGQEAQVKITAYDFTIFGDLDGFLEHIGADTVTDDRGNSFYKIRVRTTKNYLGTENNPLPIIPGMVTSVDIISGKKTILDYLLKPFRKAREKALRER